MFSNYSIKTRLLILVSLMFATLVLLGILGWYSNHLAEEGQRNIYEGGNEEITSLHEITKAINTAIIDLTKVTSQIWNIEEGEKALNQTESAIKENWKRYRTSSTSQNSSRKDQVEQLDTMLQNTLSSFKQLGTLLTTRRDQLHDALFRDISSTFEPANEKIEQLIQSHSSETASDYQNALSTSKTFTDITLISMAIAILLISLFAWILIKNILNALAYAISIINKVADGETDLQIAVKSQDEIGQLLLAMQHMVTTANKMAAALESVASGDLTVNTAPRSNKDILGMAMRDMIDKLRRMISKIQAEAKTLSDSSNEIVTSVTQVSANTAETASAVTETTTTSEELKQTAHIASKKAQGVLNYAEDTLKIVKSSEQSVNSTINDMHEIQEKMRTISESIMKLSEHNLAIGEIIDTVNDLAEQSNLLAVNAAIEAARAGEQGKSFGVVALEIRNLAEQSKNATVQVRSILNDVQNDTSSAVMATEQGSKAVAKGVDQSAQTAEAINTLLNSINMVAQAAKQIAISSQQQLVGVDQVNIAMSNINEASSQHVEHMRQIESAVISLNSVGSSLKALTQQYKMAHMNNPE
ncbi:methyl-accepting chemotaxis protein [Candidatus Protochlamydia phocaeensis]|uniref:methyl-accepting chemotaxis protein n=1 Tax=Candidatus Protochlamydia phocaeensis TaxID=1414722 RepID=UPI0008392027|nr:methyl-accepting chemotaxis protein [Candidatus Protochlamydia phocaeensis]